jgi:membrane protease YdiL (CAAX protease family)
VDKNSRLIDAVPVLGVGIIFIAITAPQATYFEYGAYWFNLTVPCLALTALLWHATKAGAFYSRGVCGVKPGSLFFLYATLIFIFVLEAITAIANGRGALEVVMGNGGLNELWMRRVVVAPLVEELIFRHFLLAALVSKTGRVHRSNTLVSVLFVAVHLPGWVGDPSKSPLHIVVAFLISLLFGYLFISRGRIVESIACHSLVNHLG